MRKVNKTLVLILALFLIPDAGNAMAQIIAIGPPSFQSNDFPSLETTILDRLALYGSDDPADLGTLAHLTVLESIAMLADIQYDMPNTILGARLESQIRQLWDSAAVFEEGVSSGPMSAKMLTDSQPLFASMQGAVLSIESVIGNSAAVPNRVGAHLRDITRLTGASGTLMRAIESDFQSAMPARPQPAATVLRLGTEARLLANAIVRVIQNVKNSKQVGSNWSVVRKDLEELLELVQNLEKTIASQPTDQEIAQSLGAVRRRMWRVEARIVGKLSWPTDLAREWRAVREQLNLISDTMGLERIIDRGQAADGAKPSAVEQPVKPLVRIYRGPPTSSADLPPR